MQTTRRLQFVHGQLAWMLSVILLLALLDSLTVELFFVISLIGLLIVVELTAPFRITPQWRKRLWVLIGLGLLGFGVIVIRRILDILPPGVL
jgi:hypothetical protein